MKKTSTKPTTTKPTAKATNAKPTPTKPVPTSAPTPSVPPTPTPVSLTNDATKPDTNATDATIPVTPTLKATAKKKPTPNTKPKRLSALDAAAHVLKNAGKPLNAQELITAMKDQQLWQSPSGQTPHATLHAAISTDIKKKGAASRFRKAHRGHFTHA